MHVIKNVPSDVLVKVYRHTCTKPPAAKVNVKHLLPQFGHFVPNHYLDFEIFFPLQGRIE